jgi:hypothetical protein
MRKTFASFVLGVSLIVGSALAAASSNKELEQRVNSLENNPSAIVSCVSGRIEAPLEVIKSYIRKPILSSKVTMALGNSPYFVNPEGKGFTFVNGSYTSRYESVRENEEKNYFHHLSFIKGNRIFGNFESSMELYFQASSNKTTRYSNKMHIKLQNRFFNSFLRNLLNAPIVGTKLKRFFEEEQEKIVGDINKSIQRAKTKPELIDGLGSYTNGAVYFNQEEIDFIRNSVELMK